MIGTSNKNDIILDPFFGTGTTGAVAKKLGRHFIGIEKDKSYIEVASKRISKTIEHDNSCLEVTKSKRSLPRIPFGSLIERGILSPGQDLQSFNGRHIAKIRADGTLISHNTKGSIHQVGAKLEGLPSCNGWAYWHFKIDGSSAPIDVLRQKLISEISNINH